MIIYLCIDNNCLFSGGTTVFTKSFGKFSSMKLVFQLTANGGLVVQINMKMKCSCCALFYRRSFLSSIKLLNLSCLF